jgi:hypothetical protein
VAASLSGFKHGQNETITFNLKRAEDPGEDFAFVQGTIVRYVVLCTGPTSDQHLQASLSRAAFQDLPIPPSV